MIINYYISPYLRTNYYKNSVFWKISDCFFQETLALAIEDVFKRWMLSKWHLSFQGYNSPLCNKGGLGGI